jgi:Na+/H+ antiporter NhaD/arsenite permease-like protein
MTGLISAFVENVATVLIVAPIALALAKKLKINPMNMLIAIAVSSNLQGTATLIGDPPSMLLAGFTKMNFNDFFFYHGRPSIFFAVETGAVASFLVLYFVFRKHREKAALIPVEIVRSWVPTFILIITIILLAASSFYDRDFSYQAGIICTAAGLISLMWRKLAVNGSVRKTIGILDWDSTIFLAGVFVLVGSLTATGLIESLANIMANLAGNNILFAYIMTVFLSVLISAFVDNVPFLAAMLPAAISVSAKLGVQPQMLVFGLLIGASLGGNITPIGASANIVACGLLKKEGHIVRFRDFAKIGLPFTIAAVSAASLFVWFVWK